MIICGQEFDFSALNADDLDRMERAQQHMQAASDRESLRTRTSKVSAGDILRGQCRLMMGYFDELLGEGASERLGLDGNDFGGCVRVTNAIKEAIAAEQASVKQATAVPVNREQRRAQKKHGRPVSRSEGFNPKVVNRPAQPVTEKNVFWPGTETDARSKTNQLIDAQQAMNDLRDDPDAMQQLAECILKLSAERHV